MAEKLVPPSFVCDPAEPEKIAQDVAESHATAFRVPLGMFASPESEVKEALLPEIVADITVPDDPTRTHSVAVGHETA
jgi:hypothetical protein